MSPVCSVVISFYEKPRELALVLAGFERQTCPDFEILIADDGSSPATVANLHALMRAWPGRHRIRHLWQEDEGFRKNRILNQAVRAAASDYLIFVDGDCIPHRVFVEAHLTHRASGRVLTGRRANLSRRISEWLTPERVRSGVLERPLGPLLWDAVRGGTRRLEQAWYLRHPRLRAWVNRKRRGLLGCNMSMWKRDLEAINGFDERYRAPGVGEDSDIDHRLRLLGREIVGLSNVAVQYHLYHRLLPRSPDNDALFAAVKASGRIQAPQGLRGDTAG